MFVVLLSPSCVEHMFLHQVYKGDAECVAMIVIADVILTFPSLFNKSQWDLFLFVKRQINK